MGRIGSVAAARRRIRAEAQAERERKATAIDLASLAIDPDVPQDIRDASLIILARMSKRQQVREI